MAVFDAPFARMLMHDLGAVNLLPLIKTRHHRMALERLLGLVLSWGGANPLEDLSLHYHAVDPCMAIQGHIGDSQRDGIGGVGGPCTGGRCFSYGRCAKCSAVLQSAYHPKPWSSATPPMDLDAEPFGKLPARTTPSTPWACNRSRTDCFLIKCCMGR